MYADIQLESIPTDQRNNMSERTSGKSAGNEVILTDQAVSHPSIEKPSGLPIGSMKRHPHSDNLLISIDHPPLTEGISLPKENVRLPALHKDLAKAAPLCDNA